MGTFRHGRQLPAAIIGLAAVLVCLMAGSQAAAREPAAGDKAVPAKAVDQASAPVPVPAQAPPLQTGSSDKPRPATASAAAAQAPPLQVDRSDKRRPATDKPSQASDQLKPEAPPAQWHRLQMRISGSMCPACLKELGEHLQRLEGVSMARFERPAMIYSVSYSPDVTNWADGVVIYDSSRISLDAVRLDIKDGGYHSYRISDQELGHEPAAHDLKFAR